MRSRITSILLLALVLSGGATFLVYRALAMRGQGSAAQTTPALLAAHDLPLGSVIKESDLKVALVSGPLLKGAATRKELLIGRGVVAQIFQDEVILESRLAAPGAGGGLASIIPPGYRAVAVRVNEIVGVGGFVLPGMHVDVLISAVPPGNAAAAGAKARTILQNIEVLSAGQNYQKDAEGKPTVVPVVNLLVKPEQAEMLSLANSETKIQLVLRNPLDNEAAPTPGAALAGLFGETPAPAPSVRPRVQSPAPAPVIKPVPVTPSVPASYLIEVINGPQRSEAKLPRNPEERQ